MLKYYLYEHIVLIVAVLFFQQRKKVFQFDLFYQLLYLLLMDNINQIMFFHTIVQMILFLKTTVYNMYVLNMYVCIKYKYKSKSKLQTFYQRIDHLVY